MNTANFANLLREIKNPQTSSLYEAFVETLRIFNFDVASTPNQQWVEAWLETSPATSIELTDQGIYVALTIREKILEKFTALLKERLDLNGFNHTTPPYSVKDKITALEIESWLELDMDWLLTLITTIYCNINGIDNKGINPQLNGLFSIYASSYNDRVTLSLKAIEYIECGILNANDLEEMLDFFGPFFILSFCEDEMLKQRTINAVGVA